MRGRINMDKASPNKYGRNLIDVCQNFNLRMGGWARVLVTLPVTRNLVIVSLTI